MDFLHKIFKQILNYQNKHIEMNRFSCSLSSSWKAIIDCLFYAFHSLSGDVSMKNTAKLVVAWL